MKLLHISDSHTYHHQFPKTRFEGIDILVHSGDESNSKDPYRNREECLDFIEWYKNIPIKHKIFVAGNHSTAISQRRVTPADFHEAGITYLENNGTTIEDIKFWGSPYTPKFGEWSFMKSRETINRVWENIPKDTDVLIVHGPPKGIRDLSHDKDGTLEFCGDGALMKAVLKLQPKLMLFGHIHDSPGCYNQGISHHSNISTLFSNGACVEDGKFDRGLTSFGNILEI